MQAFLFIIIIITTWAAFPQENDLLMSIKLNEC